MKRNTRRNSAHLMLWMAMAALPVSVLTSFMNELPAIAQSAAPAFELPQALPQDASLSIESDNSMAVVSESLKQQFASQFGDASVAVSVKDSDAALAKLTAGEADVAATGRPLTEAELAQGLTPLVLEREKIAVFVAEENAFNGDIGLGQFAQIFRGELTDWSELGGQAGPIRFIDRPDSSDTRRSLSFYPVFQATEFSAGATAQPIGEDNTALVVKNLGTDGLGYAPYSQVKDVPGIRILSMHKVLPDNAAYPYSQPRILAYKGEATPAVQAFLAVATSSGGQTAISTAEAAEATALAAGENPQGEAALAKVGASSNAVQTAVAGAVDSAAAAGRDAANVAGDAVRAVGATAGAAGEAVSEAASGAADTAGEVADAAGNAVNAAGETAGNAVNAAGETAGNAVNAAGEAAGSAVDAAGEAANAAGNAASNVADAAGAAANGAVDAATNTTDSAANAAGEAAEGLTEAAGEVVSQLPGAGAIEGRGFSPLWGILPLAAIAAGGGLLWWLAADKEEEEELLVEPTGSYEVASSSQAARSSQVGGLQADAQDSPKAEGSAD